MCVGKTKGPPEYFYPFLLGARGGGDARGEWGRVRGSQPAFLRAFWANDERSDEGEGGQHINPLPQAAITIKALITRAPTTYFPQEPRHQPEFLRAFWANDE
jgi:hypothetical protein